MGSSSVEDSLAGELDSRSERDIAILRAAYQVMARSGSNRLSLQDIADQAGVSKGLILYHFQTKSALLHQAMQWALVATASRIRTALEAATDPNDRLGALLDAIFVSPQANRDFQLVYLDLIEHSVRELSFAELPLITRRIIEALYADLVRDGVDEGVFTVDDVDNTALLMRIVIDGTFLQWLQRPDWRDSHQQFKERCHDTLWTLLQS